MIICGKLRTTPQIRGIEWTVLTNGTEWRVYKVLFTKPIEKKLVYEFDFSKINPKKQGDLELLYYLCIEAFQKSTTGALEELHTQKQIFNRYIIGHLMLTEHAVDSIRKIIRKYFPEIKVDNEELIDLITNEIFKREIIEGEQAEDARKRVQRLEKSFAAKPKITKLTVPEQ